MIVQFHKLQGTGNDFVAFDFRSSPYPVSKLKLLAPRLCDRRFGIGADGILALYAAESSDTAYTMLYLNADGSDAGMCGNGGRCIARLAHSLGIPSVHQFSVHGFPYSAVVDGHEVSLNFPATPEIHTIQDEEFGFIEILNTGTEHICIKFTDSSMINDHNWLRRVGKRLRYDQRFAPKGTNVNFYCPIDADSIKLITYERGVEDLTLSCGTGSLAAAICHGNASNTQTVKVVNTGGEVTCSFNPTDKPGTFKNLTLKGPAEIVFQGSITLD